MTAENRQKECGRQGELRMPGYLGAPHNLAAQWMPTEDGIAEPERVAASRILRAETLHEVRKPEISSLAPRMDVGIRFRDVFERVRHSL